MSMLTMAAPSPHSAFKQYPWDGGRSTSDYSSRPRIEPERIALPSIRQAIPELHLRLQPQEASTTRTTSSNTSPTVGYASIMTPPEYVHSPNSNKRRRLSTDEEQESERVSRVPRLYESPARIPQRHVSPPAPSRSATESWTGSARTSPYMSSSGIPSMRSPAMEVHERPEMRPTLPSLPPMNFERDPIPMQRARGHSQDEFQPIRPSMGMSTGPMMESAPYRTSGYAYGYHHPSRVQSLSLGAIHPFDRTPFSAAGYGHYPEFMRIGELGAMGMHGDSKQRKRRGNLPKETTDKLRAWFVAHLHHPYPTEDEKQDLMRQTGLQMNQISNWFINARRRQLPTMISNARAESDAMSSRSGESKILPSTERGEYDDGKRSSVPLSDGEAFDEDLDSLKHRRSAHIKRGSV
ncbi:Homeobox protein PKNOX1 [Colletotrichum tanaceti]|uniref:Homeobox protein PKNOX1 n=1 Tax=Colletotrichum tanaceti TaxID=1306861 RepID=A0A4U6X514_9PEZI|nr:Homeobox protein PKNOX1 [Colletotrichum tanaceti]TKW50124.1 Homeobox protein PKNOX1 [Colletotrichum tanaceti]